MTNLSQLCGWANRPEPRRPQLMEPGEEKSRVRCGMRVFEGQCAGHLR